MTLHLNICFKWLLCSNEAVFLFLQAVVPKLGATKLSQWSHRIIAKIPPVHIMFRIVAVMGRHGQQPSRSREPQSKKIGNHCSEGEKNPLLGPNQMINEYCQLSLILFVLGHLIVHLDHRFSWMLRLQLKLLSSALIGSPTALLLKGQSSNLCMDFAPNLSLQYDGGSCDLPHCLTGTSLPMAWQPVSPMLARISSRQAVGPGKVAAGRQIRVIGAGIGAGPGWGRLWHQCHLAPSA